MAEGIAQLEALKKQLGIAQMEKRIKQIVDTEINGLLDEMKKDDDRIARTQKVLMDIHRWQTEKATYKYEKVMDFVMTQVNQDVKYKILMELRAYETISKVKPSLGFAARTEGLLKEGLWDKIVGWFKSLLPKLKAKGSTIDGNLDKLESILRK